MPIANPFVQLALGVWLLATVACFAVKNNDPLICAAGFTCLAGLGYVMTHAK